MSALAGAAGIVLAVSEPGEERSVLFPAINELIWGLVSFGVFTFFMMKWVLPRARQALAERTAGIEGKLEQAERDRTEAQALLVQYREQLADARSEAGRIRNEAQTQRAQIVEEARAEARTEAQRILDAALAQIATERQQALAELRRDVGSLAVTLAGKVVGESLEDDARQRRTVERFLDSLDGAAPAPAAASRP